MTLSAPYFFPARIGIRALLGAALLVAAWCMPAYADDPFDMEPSGWISFDRYKEKPANWIPPEVRAQAALEPVVIPPPTLPPDMPMITDPTRPIVNPVMPGVNKDFDVRVSTTADDNAAPVVLEGKEPELAVPKNRWKDALRYARDKTQAKTEDDDVKDGPLDVRFTFLPAMTAAAAKPKIESVVRKTETAPAQPPLPITIAKPPAADPAIAAAIEAYKQRQLAAIASDRQTLEALQAAIAQLGLQKKLDFMTGAGGSLKFQEASPADPNPSTVKN